MEKHDILYKLSLILVSSLRVYQVAYFNELFSYISGHSKTLQTGHDVFSLQ